MLTLQATMKNIPNLNTNRLGIVLTVVLGVFVSMSVIGQVTNAQADPSLDQVKAAAEKGDAAAQCELARLSPDPEESLLWYRKSAAQGNTNAQYLIAEMLVYRAGLIATPKERSRAQIDEAMKWYVAAANLGHKRAQIELGRIYRSGQLVPKDLPEAYKWYSIVLATDPAWSGRSVPIERDGVVRSMTPEQLEEGKLRVANFIPPQQTVTAPEPALSPLEKLTLRGILVTKDRRLAIVNGQTVAAGESASVAIDGKNYRVRCLSVGDGTARVSIEGVPGTKELRVKGVPRQAI